MTRTAAVMIGIIAATAAGAAESEASRVWPVFFSRGVMEDYGESEKPRASEQLKKIELHALRGEYEPFTFAFCAPMKVTVSCSDLVLKREPGAMIPASEVEIMGLAKGGKLYRRTTKDWYLATEGEATAAAGKTARFWVTVHVPADAKPGLYSGKLRLTAGREKGHIPFTVRVSKASLDDAPPKHFYLLGTVSPYGQYYRSVKAPAAVRPEAVKFYRELKSHGMTGICPKANDFPYRAGDIRGLAAEVDAALEAGLKGPVVWNMQALIDAAKGGDRYDFNGRMDNWSDAKGLARLREIVAASQKMRRGKGWPEIIYYQIDEPGTQYDMRNFLLRSMHILEVSSKLLKELGVRSHSTITEPIDDKHNRAPRWSKTPDEMRRLWDRSRPYLSVRNYGYGYPQGRTDLEHEMADAKKRGHETWFYNNAAVMGTNRYCSRIYFGLWSWKVGLDGVTAWTYPGGRTLQFEILREGIDDHRALSLLDALVKGGRGSRADRAAAKEFLDGLRASVKLDANGFIGDWAQVAQQSMKAEKLGTDWKVVAFDEFKAELVDHIDRLSGR